MTGPRIAILGLQLLANRMATATDEAALRGHCWLEGEAIMRAGRAAIADRPRGLPNELPAFIAAMDATGAWTPVPVLIAAAPAGGPIDGGLLDRILDFASERLRAAGPVDAVYIAGRGAIVAADRCDGDGDLCQLARDLCGPAAAIVATVGLQANLTERMAAACDLIYAARTDDGRDLTERARDAALGIRLMLAGALQLTSELIRLPLIVAPGLVADAGGPIADVLAAAARLRDGAADELHAVTVCTGFACSGVAHAVLSVLVATRAGNPITRPHARDLGLAIWARRQEFMRPAMPIAAAVRLSQSAAMSGGGGAPIVLLDAGDLIEAGGTGRSTELLAAIAWADGQGVIAGPFVDPCLIEAAGLAGEGRTFQAVFNRDASAPGDAPFEAHAVVQRLGRGDQHRDGIDFAVIEIGGIGVIVVADRSWSLRPEPFDAVNVGAATTLIVKSQVLADRLTRRFTPSAMIHQVDTIGLTPGRFERAAWPGLPMPAFPLEPDTVWPPESDRG